MSGPFGATPWMYDESAFYPLTIDQSLKFNDDESQYLSWTPAAAGNRKTSTFSAWVKLSLKQSSFSILGAGTSGSAYFLFGIEGDDLYWEATGGGGTRRSDMELRDPSGWYHLMFVLDTTQATANDRVKLYKNGVQVTSFSSIANPAQNADVPYLNNTGTHYIGYSPALPSTYGNGYLSDIHFIDGQALDATYFGEFKENIWIPKVYNGTYGNNGFHLEFKNDDTVEGFNTVTYRGNGGSQSVSGLGFSPDLIWAKERSSTSGHTLLDTVRGVDLGLESNSTSAELNYPTDALTSFDADGFSLGSNGRINESSQTYVAWAWDAGSGSAASNTNGSITSTVKANPSYGFSIASYTGNGTAGATIGHGLSSAPDIMIVKGRNTTAAQAWRVYHKDSNASPASGVLNLNTDGAFVSSSTQWNNTAPTSSVFSVGTDPAVNENTKNYIAYCFNSVAGYSKISSYSGNGSSTGPTVTGLGFDPSFVMVKRTDGGTGSWMMYDNTRYPVNTRQALAADLNLAESSITGDEMDFITDGFQPKSSNGIINASGGTYIYMAFADTREAAFWKDVSGQGNHWTPVNLDYRDSLPDSTTNNFATMNSIDVPSTGTLSEGNLKVAGANYLRRKANWHFGANGIQSGKWYWEICNVGSAYGTDNGVIGSLTEAGGENFLVANKSYFRIGSIYKNYTSTSYVSSGTTYTSGDVVGFALDLDSSPQTIKYYHNGTLVNTDSTISAAPVLVPYVSSTNGSWPDTYYNFGQDSTFSGATTAGGNTDDNGIGDFKYAPPSGYLALCTANLPTPTIVDGSEYFNTVLYAGNSTTGHAITGVGFQPDWVWLKGRNYNGASHSLTDSVRGATKRLISDGTNAEATNAEYLQSFDADGFTVGTHAAHNASGYNYVGWNWKAGGTAVSNTDGSITSQVSANVDAGFSIVNFTSPSSGSFTVGHGLSVVPNVIIHKERGSTGNWHVWHDAVMTSSSEYLLLNSTAAKASFSNVWGTAVPDSTTFGLTVGTSVDAANTEIAYCFANTEGYLKAGSYTGNGSTDGPFVYTGFRPAWIMFWLKRTDSSTGG